MPVSEVDTEARAALEVPYIASLIRGTIKDGIVPASAFYDIDLRAIVSVIHSLPNGKADLGLLLNGLRTRGDPSKGGTWAQVLASFDRIPGVADNAAVYAEWIGAADQRARLSTTLREILADLESPVSGTDPPIAISEAAQRLGAALRSIERTGRLAPMTAEAIMAAARTPVEWIVDPLYTAKGVRILSGLGKVGKSTLALALALLSIKRLDVQGRLRGCGGISVAILDAENRESVWGRRLLALGQGMEIDVEDLLRSGRLVYVNQRSLRLDDQATIGRVVGLLRALGVGEIVVDSLTAVHRLPENDSAAMRGFFQDSIFRLRDEVGAGVTVLHHHRKPSLGSDDPGQALRGSGDLRNVVDTHISISRDPKDKSLVRIVVDAQREEVEAPTMYLRLVRDENGAQFYEAAEQEDSALVKLNTARDAVIAFLTQQGGEAETPLIVEALTRAGTPRRTTERALRDLSSGPYPALLRPRKGTYSIPPGN